MKYFIELEGMVKEPIMLAVDEICFFYPHPENIGQSCISTKMGLLQIGESYADVKSKLQNLMN